jgi:hypothetical protein
VKFKAYFLKFVAIIVIIELMGYGFIFLAKPFLNWDIRRRSTILHEQTEMLSRLIHSEKPLRMALHGDLGWVYRAGYSSDVDAINAQGLRGNKDYSLKPTSKLRIAAFGDSFTFANYVSFEDAWAAKIEQIFEYEVLNFGVGGYGIDQAFLRYRLSGAKYSPDIVLIGFDAYMLSRVGNVYPRFLDDHAPPIFKPRFVLVGDHLKHLPPPVVGEDQYVSLLENPAAIINTAKHDFWYSPWVYEFPLYDWSAFLRASIFVASRLGFRYFDDDYIWGDRVFNESSSLFELNVRIIQQFAKEARQTAQAVYVLLLPIERDLQQLRDGFPLTYQPLKNALAESGIAILDAAEAFVPYLDETDSQTAPRDTAKWFVSSHYSVIANEIVARWLGDHLKHHRFVAARPSNAHNPLNDRHISDQAKGRQTQ